LGGLFFGRVFLFAGKGRLFDPTKEWAMCRTCVGTKSMTKNKPEGHGVGKGKKDRESFNKYLKNQFNIIY